MCNIMGPLKTQTTHRLKLKVLSALSRTLFAKNFYLSVLSLLVFAIVNLK